MRPRTACALALAAALAAPGASALGDERCPGGSRTHQGKFWRRDKVRHQLRLTDDQIDRLENILARNRQRLEDMGADVKKKRAAPGGRPPRDRTAQATILAPVGQSQHRRANPREAAVRKTPA